tara:strand:+ start:2866 stop:3318 length:453 start_codon:yes stop_codon:yes gene_type:complete
MFLQKIIVILTSLLLVSATSFAQTTTSTAGKFTFLEKDQKAPFQGTLFDPVATAKILADKATAEQNCLLRLKHKKDLQNADCKKETDLLNLELEIEKKKNKLIISAQQEEIESLRSLATGADNTLWATIGFGLGALTSIAIFFAAVEVAK